MCVGDDGRHALKILNFLLQFHKKKLETTHSCIVSMNKSNQNADKKIPYIIRLHAPCTARLHLDRRTKSHICTNDAITCSVAIEAKLGIQISIFECFAVG